MTNTTNHRIKVLQVVTIMNRGGLESFVMNILRNINLKKYQVDFLVHRSAPGVFDEEILGMGCRIYYVCRANPLNRKYGRDLDEFFDSHHFDVVHSHIDCMSAFVLASARKHGIPVRIAHSHSSRQDFDIKYPIKIVSKRLIKGQATHLLACGEAAGEWMFCTKQFEVVKNGIPVMNYRFSPSKRVEARRLLCCDDGEYVIGHVGRFDSVKNHKFLIDVFRCFQKYNLNSRLVLVGDGPLLGETKELVKAYGLTDKVQFLGLRSDVDVLMQAFDVFAMPSIYEGLPLVLVEAQSSGLPCVISSSIPSDCDITQLVHRVSLEDGPVCWAEMINSIGLQRDRDNYAKVVINAGFDIQSVVSRIEQIYCTGSVE